MKKYIFSFVAEVRGEKVMRDIVEIEFGRAFRCVEIREVES